MEMLNINEQFFGFYTKLRIRLLKMNDFDVDVYTQKIQKKECTAEPNRQLLFPRTVDQ